MGLIPNFPEIHFEFGAITELAPELVNHKISRPLILADEGGARRADEAETDRIFALGHAFYSGYAKYRLRADHRIIRVFILETAT